MKVSVIIPYNRNRGYLSEAVASCERQENFTLGEDYEVIVQYGDCGVSKNINDAVAKSKGEYIKLCGEDDMMATGCLYTLYNYAKANDIDLLCANAMNFGLDGYEQLVPSRIPTTVHLFAMENTIHGGSTLYRREAMPKWNEGMWTAEEYELNLRMADAGCKFGYIDALVFYYRLHSGQKSGVYWQRDFDTKLLRYEYIEQLQNRYMGNHKVIVR